jgi:Neuraminidase (sialidase)
VKLLLLVIAALATSASAQVERNILLPPGLGNPRNSEAAMIDLADGRILLVYSRFTGGGGDHAKANLAARFSSDGGATWTGDDATVTRDEGGMNTMSPSLLRMKDGAIGVFYLRKNNLTDCRVYLRISRDDAKTWGEPVLCTPPIAYYVMNNDRAVRLKDGRIMLPVAMHQTPTQPRTSHAAISCFTSDDDGQTWSASEIARADAARVLEEPGVVELRDGRIMLWCRTDAGNQYVSFSDDRGKSWSELKPSNIPSPRSPASIKRVPSTGELLLVWNNNPDVSGKSHGKRTPLNAARSRDEGKTWENIKTLEDDPQGWYCYTAIHFVGENVVLSHCTGRVKLASTQVTRFPLKWLE